MNRPKIEDYRSKLNIIDKAAYTRDLNKYIDYLDLTNKEISDKIVSLSDNFGKWKF